MTFRVELYGNDVSKLSLQIVTACAVGVIPVVTGLIGMFGLSDPIYAWAGLPANVLLNKQSAIFRWSVA